MSSNDTYQHQSERYPECNYDFRRSRVLFSRPLPPPDFNEWLDLQFKKAKWEIGEFIEERCDFYKTMFLNKSLQCQYRIYHMFTNNLMREYCGNHINFFDTIQMEITDKAKEQLDKQLSDFWNLNMKPQTHFQGFLPLIKK